MFSEKCLTVIIIAPLITAATILEKPTVRSSDNSILTSATFGFIILSGDFSVEMTFMIRIIFTYARLLIDRHTTGL